MKMSRGRLSPSRIAIPVLIVFGGILFASLYFLRRRRQENKGKEADNIDDEHINQTTEANSEKQDTAEISINLSDESESVDNVSLTTIPPQEHIPEVHAPSHEEIVETITALSGDGGGNNQNMTLRQAEVLTSLLSHPDETLQQTATRITANSAAFTRNQNTLREAGCLARLVSMLRTHSMALKLGYTTMYPAVISSVTTAVNNLALNEENQKQLKECIPALIDFAVSDQSPEAVQLSTLQALTNLSLTSSYHGPYTCLIQQLYQYLDSDSAALQCQAMKVLMNLSTNPDMVPHLLAAKGPTCAYNLLNPSNPEDYILRWLTILSNITQTALKNDITYTSLPTDYKAPSPETMYTALYGLDNTVRLRSKVFVLTKHQNEEIRHQAACLYSCLE